MYIHFIGRQATDVIEFLLYFDNSLYNCLHIHFAEREIKVEQFAK